MKHVKLFENFKLNEGEMWIGKFDSSYNDIAKLQDKIRETLRSGKNGASFNYLDTDFTIVKNGERYNITSGTGDPNIGELNFSAVSLESAIRQAYIYAMKKK